MSNHDNTSFAVCTTQTLSALGAFHAEDKKFGCDKVSYSSKSVPKNGNRLSPLYHDIMRGTEDIKIRFRHKRIP